MNYAITQELLTRQAIAMIRKLRCEPDQGEVFTYVDFAAHGLDPHSGTIVTRIPPEKSPPSSEGDNTMKQLAAGAWELTQSPANDAPPTSVRDTTCRWEHASTEPLSVIEADECLRLVSMPSTQRFRRVFNALKDRDAEIAELRRQLSERGSFY